MDIPFLLYSGEKSLARRLEKVKVIALQQLLVVVAGCCVMVTCA